MTLRVQASYKPQGRKPRHAPVRSGLMRYGDLMVRSMAGWRGHRAPGCRPMRGWMRRWWQCTRRARAAMGGRASCAGCASWACRSDMSGYAAAYNGKRCGRSTSAPRG